MYKIFNDKLIDSQIHNILCNVHCTTFAHKDINFWKLNQIGQT